MQLDKGRCPANETVSIASRIGGGSGWPVVRVFVGGVWFVATEWKEAEQQDSVYLTGNTRIVEPPYQGDH